MSRTRQLATELGVLRLMLLTLAGTLALFSTDPGASLSLHGWGLISSFVLPAATPIVFFVLLFDILMSSVRLADALPQMRGPWRRVLIAEIGFTLFLLMAWLPFFREVLAPVTER